MEEKIIQKIKSNFDPEFFELINNSHLHKGHFKPTDSGLDNQTHFLIKIYSTKVKNLSKISIHRQINQLLKEEFEAGMHALEIRIISEDDFKNNLKYQNKF
jgi:BolA protein